MRARDAWPALACAVVAAAGVAGCGESNDEKARKEVESRSKQIDRDVRKQVDEARRKIERETSSRDRKKIEGQVRRQIEQARRAVEKRTK